MPTPEVMIQTLVKFQIGELPEGYLALLLAYATSQEKLSRHEMESFAIALSREKATELGLALLRQAEQPPSGKPPTPRQ